MLPDRSRVLNVCFCPILLVSFTFATRYLAANPDDLRGLAALLGHNSLDMVMCYTEPTLEDITAKMERVDAGFLRSVNPD